MSVVEVNQSSLCKVLVIEKLHNKFETGVIPSSKISWKKHKEKEVPSVIKDPMREFLKWYDDMTSSPFSLQCQCRMLIRRTLVSLSDRRSILPRIDSLDLPNKLKQYLRKYEGRANNTNNGTRLASGSCGETNLVSFEFKIY